MTPKDKAKELVDKYLDKKCFDGRYGEDYNYIYCVSIAVDEIIEILWHTHKNESEYKYWQEVKQEIEKL